MGRVTWVKSSHRCTFSAVDEKQNCHDLGAYRTIARIQRPQAPNHQVTVLQLRTQLSRNFRPDGMLGSRQTVGPVSAIVQEDS